jgi:predicted phage-related endonuclease
MSLTPEELGMLGGSDLSALLGLNPYRSAFDIYRRVVEGVETPDGPLLRRGRLMEPVIRCLATEDLGLKLLGPRKVKDEARPWLRLSLDDVALAAGGVEQPVEFKSVAFHAASEYGESGTDEVPLPHLLQCQAYIHGLRAPSARLVALIGLDDLREYILRADLELQSMLLEAAERFWVDHVLPKRPPPLDGTEACSTWLAGRFPRNTGTTVPARPEDEHWAHQLAVARVAKDAAEEMERQARNQLVAAIGDADGMASPNGWRISHKLVKGRAKTDWEAVAREANVPPSLIERHTTIGAGYRRFLPAFPKEK